MQAYREVDCDKNEKVNNMDYMFKTEGDVDVAVDVFAEYGGWDNINIDVLISKPVIWNFKPMLEQLKPIQWNFEKKIDNLKPIRWEFGDRLNNTDFTPYNWNFINQLQGIPRLIWPFKPQLLKLKHGKWYFPSQLDQLDLDPIVWGFTHQTSQLGKLIWGFESQLSTIDTLHWSFVAQIQDTMRKQRAFIQQLGVSKIRWTFKPQLRNLKPLNWNFPSQIASMPAIRWLFPEQLHEKAFPPIKWAFTSQVTQYNHHIGWDFRRMCADIEQLAWDFQRNLSRSCYSDDLTPDKRIQWKFTKNLDSAIMQSSVPWHFRPQLANTKKVNWNFDVQIPQTTMKDMSLEQVQMEKIEFQDKYLDSYHKPYMEYRKAVHSKHKRHIDYKHSERHPIKSS